MSHTVHFQCLSVDDCAVFCLPYHCREYLMSNFTLFIIYPLCNVWILSVFTFFCKRIYVIMCDMHLLASAF